MAKICYKDYGKIGACILVSFSTVFTNVILKCLYFKLCQNLTNLPSISWMKNWCYFSFLRIHSTSDAVMLRSNVVTSYEPKCPRDSGMLPTSGFSHRSGTEPGCRTVEDTAGSRCSKAAGSCTAVLHRSARAAVDTFLGTPL